MIIRPSLAGLTEKHVPTPLDISSMPTARLAYGLRKLRAAYTGNAIRVRRSSNDDEADVAFYNGKEVTLNSTVSSGGTLRDFISTGTAYVTTWYNQSGNSSTQAGGGSWSGYDTDPNATQTTTSNQPEIISSGSVNEGISFVSSSTRYFNVTNYRLPNANTGDAFTYVWCGQIADYSVYAGLISNLDNYNDGVELMALNTAAFRIAVDSNDEDSATSYPADKDIVVIGSYDRTRASAQGGDGSSQIVRVNGNETTMDTDEDKHVGSSDRFKIGVRKIDATSLDGTCSEVYVFESQLSQALQISLERNMAIYNGADLA
tara:strand:+ start:359 stop:1309 length:951 start_codon:yes stop_codon:yes gene_type:complete